MKTTESREMYLETILKLRNRGSRCCAIDVAAELGFSRPSVSNAVKLLHREGYIYVDDGGELTLTELGAKKANEIYERHVVLTKLLEKIGANAEDAEENACRIEHVISEDVFQLIKKYVD